MPLALIFDIVPDWHIWPPKEVESKIEGIGKFDGAVHTEIIQAESTNNAVEFNKGSTQWPEHHTYEADLFGNGQVKNYACFEGRAIAWLPAVISKDAPLGETTITIEAKVQSCSSKNCRPPANIVATVTFEIVAADQTPTQSETSGIFDSFPPKLYNDLRNGVAPPYVVTFDIFGFSFNVDAAGSGLFLLLAVAAQALPDCRSVCQLPDCQGHTID